MALPRKIQELEAQADAALAAMSQSQDNSPFAEPAAAAQPSNPPDPTPAVPQPAVEPAAPAPVAETPPAAEPKVDWEQKYRSLQGIFNSQVPQLQRQVQELTRKLETQASQPAQPAPPEPAPARVADPKDVETFGADLVQMVQRVAETMFSNAARAVEARLNAVEQKLAGTASTVAKSDEELFFIRLTQLEPAWESLNTDPEFLSWLQEADPVYGVPRQAALAAAQERLDADRAATVFRVFRASRAPAAPPPAAAPNPLEKQIAPRASAPAPTSSPEKPVFREADVTAFYNDVARGKYAGREREQERIEALINQALAEGRIR